MDFFGLKRQKTMSESSDDGGNKQRQQQQFRARSSSTSDKQLMPTGFSQQTSADQGRYFHDDHGMVAYSYYERKPQYLDTEGKIQYKYFNQYKHLVGGGGDDKYKKFEKEFKQLEEKEPEQFFYDVDGGKVKYHTYYYPSDRKKFVDPK